MFAVATDFLTLNRPRSRGALQKAAPNPQQQQQKKMFGASRSRAQGCRSRSTHRRLGCDVRGAPRQLHAEEVREGKCQQQERQADEAIDAAEPAKVETTEKVEAVDLLAELGICTSTWVDQLVADAEEPDEASISCEWDEPSFVDDVMGVQIQSMFAKALSCSDADDASFEAEDEDEKEASHAKSFTDVLANAAFMDAFGMDIAAASLPSQPDASADLLAVREEVPAPEVAAEAPGPEQFFMAELEKNLWDMMAADESEVDDDEFEGEDLEELLALQSKSSADALTTPAAKPLIGATQPKAASASKEEHVEKPLMSRRRRALLAAGASVSPASNQYASAMEIPTLAGRGIAAVRGLRKESNLSANLQEVVRARRAQREIPKRQSAVFQLDTPGDSGCESEASTTRGKKYSLIESYDALGAQFYNMDSCNATFASPRAPAKIQSGMSALELDLGLVGVRRPSSGKLKRSSSETFISSSRQSSASGISGRGRDRSLSSGKLGVV
eukprot:TRINITY_DN2853_c0_g2_i1.p1 TRINITY_DN2853_c0_g2~~TRINITY_DN2853_c0_g2_i1.p1  ORF type:complete len:502 (-),score=136.99 TRINITY_DN2853_c0_g2_i1:197-1702(-)